MSTNTMNLMQELRTAMNRGTFAENEYEAIDLWFEQEQRNGQIPERLTLSEFARIMAENPQVAQRWDESEPGVSAYLAEAVRFHDLTRTMHAQYL